MILLATAVSADEFFGTDYAPMTEVEVMSWLNRASVEQVMQVVMEWDFVKNATPTIIFPTHDVVVTDDEITLTPRGAIVIRIGRFWWGVTPPVETATYDPAGLLPGYLWGAVGLGIGALATFLLGAIFSK